jgi:hypothetical protein
MTASTIRYNGAVYHLADADLRVEDKIEAVIPFINEYLQSSGVGTGGPEDETTARSMADIFVHAVWHDKLFDEAPTEHAGFYEWRNETYPKNKVGAGVHDIVTFLGMHDSNLFQQAVDAIRPKIAKSAAQVISYKGATYKLAVQGQELNPRQLADQITMHAVNAQQLFAQKLEIAKQALSNGVSSDEGETAKERLSNMLKDAESTYNHVWRLLDSMENFGSSKTTAPATEEVVEEKEVEEVKEED